MSDEPPDTRADLIADLQKKCDEFRGEAERCRAISKAVLDGMNTKGVCVDIIAAPAGVLRIVICAPNLNEENLGGPAREILAELCKASGAVMGAVVKEGVTGTEAERKAGREP